MTKRTPNEINDRFKFFLRRGLDERNALGHALDELRAFADRNVVSYRPSWNGAKLRQAISDALCG